MPSFWWSANEDKKRLYSLQSLYIRLFKPQRTIYFRNVFSPGLLKRFWLSPRKGMLSSLFFRYLDSSPKFSPLKKKIVIIYFFLKQSLIFSVVVNFECLSNLYKVSYIYSFARPKTHILCLLKQIIYLHISQSTLLPSKK